MTRATAAAAAGISSSYSSAAAPNCGLPRLEQQRLGGWRRSSASIAGRLFGIVPSSKFSLSLKKRCVCVRKVYLCVGFSLSHLSLCVQKSAVCACVWADRKGRNSLAAAQTPKTANSQYPIPRACPSACPRDDLSLHSSESPSAENISSPKFWGITEWGWGF